MRASIPFLLLGTTSFYCERSHLVTQIWRFTELGASNTLGIVLSLAIGRGTKWTLVHRRKLSRVALINIRIGNH